jgi:Cdc6-like AAA superfamily ATPase
MSPFATALAKYWRSNILDSARQIDADAITLYEIAPSHLSSGILSKSVCALLWEDAGSKNAQTQTNPLLPVLIAPIFLRGVYEGGKQRATAKNSQVPLWIVAQCDRRGTLTVCIEKTAEDSFIVDRNVVAPLASSIQTYTTVAQVDDFFNHHPITKGQSDLSWEQAWVYAEELFRSVFSTTPADWSKAYAQVNSGPMIAYREESLPKSSWPHIRAIYEKMEEVDQEKALPLFVNMITSNNSCDIQTSNPCLTAQRKRHFGQMGGRYPLTKGQRDALGAALSVPESALVAVNGPPGTGKTTLIQSVVASLWIEAAVKKTVPPVIMVSSTNNQAIANILESFTRATLPDGHRLSNSLLAKRWIPQVRDYGLLLPALSKAAEGPYHAAYYIRKKDPWCGLPRLTENEEFVDKARETWLSAATKWNSNVSSIESGISLLHNTLYTLSQQIARIWELRENCAILFADITQSNDLRSKVKQWIETKASRQNQLSILNDQAHIVLTYFQGIEGLFSWLPFVRRRIWTRIYAHLSKYQLVEEQWNWETILSERQLRAWLSQKKKTLCQTIDEISFVISNWEALIKLIDKLLPGHDAMGLALFEGALQEALDIQIRTELFCLAGRYWEGRWLLEMERVLSEIALDPKKMKLLTGWNRQNCEARWRRFSMLTPCLVATAYIAPRMLEYFNVDDQKSVPLFNFLDLLMVEEAGQVSPEIGAPLFAFARRALVIGDTRQIKPVWNVTHAVDHGNAQATGLDGCINWLETRGMTSSEGSVMQMAQAATHFLQEGYPGIFLRDHFRCRPSIIAYCNELAYANQLKPMREDGKYFLPPLGHANVFGRASKRGTSWRNEIEAGAIAAWIRKNKELLCQGRPLKEVVAILTPFRAQMTILKNALKKVNLSEDNIVVGTVHSLQGAERDVVIFSPVYDANTAPHSLFFDYDVNVLNVVVSRAKNSFLVFGDVRIFRRDRDGGKAPSAILAKYLFTDPSCEILDVEPTENVDAEFSSPERMGVDETRRPKIFICYAREDSDAAANIYEYLKRSTCDPWLDKRSLVAGQNWDYEIRKAVRAADFFVVLLSQNSVSKRGYVQREFKLAMELLEEIPEGQIYLIPVKIDNCLVPSRFATLQWVDLKGVGDYEEILKAIQFQQSSATRQGAAK